MIPDEVLRAALEEHIAFGPDRKRPAEERLARRLPLVPPATRRAALEAAGEAVEVAYELAREYTAGGRTQASVEAELARRFPWLRAGPPAARRPWWRRLPFWSRAREADLVVRLGHYGYYLAIN